MTRKPAFFLDLMLAGMAGWLRMVGVQCIYAGDLKVEDDEEIIKYCLKNRLVLATRDKRLYQKACNYTKACLLPNGPAHKQVRFLLRQFGINVSTTLKQPMLCPTCGGNIRRIRKARVKEQVFPRVYELNNTFYQCKTCKKIFWKGSHFKGIKKFYAKIKQAAVD